MAKVTKNLPAVKLPRTVWALGLVSMFMDVSSEMIHSLLPVFMVGALGVSVVLVGFLDGFAEALALIVKVFSGAISDYFGKRKWLPPSATGLARSPNRCLPSPTVSAPSSSLASPTALARVFAVPRATH
ncbi:MAG: hypothetical protein ACKOQ8_07860 [Micrococcales bacterium]